jgi:hypothetical protein
MGVRGDRLLADSNLISTEEGPKGSNLLPALQWIAGQIGKVNAYSKAHLVQGLSIERRSRVRR